MSYTTDVYFPFWNLGCLRLKHQQLCCLLVSRCECLLIVASHVREWQSQSKLSFVFS
jgi:hypothetical protein